MPQKKVAQIYEDYKIQIEVIRNMPDTSALQAATIISWLYGGGTEHAWRLFLARRAGIKKMPEGIAALVEKLKKK